MPSAASWGRARAAAAITAAARAARRRVAEHDEPRALQHEGIVQRHQVPAAEVLWCLVGEHDRAVGDGEQPEVPDDGDPVGRPGVAELPDAPDPVDPLRRVQRRDLERERYATAAARACRTARRGPPCAATDSGLPPSSGRRSRKAALSPATSASAAAANSWRARSSVRSRSARASSSDEPRSIPQPAAAAQRVAAARERGPGWRYGVLRARGLPRRIEGSAHLIARCRAPLTPGGGGPDLPPTAGGTRDAPRVARVLW